MEVRGMKSKTLEKHSYTFMLLALMAVVMFNDILRIFRG